MGLSRRIVWQHLTLSNRHQNCPLTFKINVVYGPIYNIFSLLLIFSRNLRSIGGKHMIKLIIVIFNEVQNLLALLSRLTLLSLILLCFFHHNLHVSLCSPFVFLFLCTVCITNFPFHIHEKIKSPSTLILIPSLYYLYYLTLMIMILVTNNAIFHTQIKDWISLFPDK